LADKTKLMVKQVSRWECLRCHKAHRTKALALACFRQGEPEFDYDKENRFQERKTEEILIIVSRVIGISAKTGKHIAAYHIRLGEMDKVVTQKWLNNRIGKKKRFLPLIVDKQE